MDPVTGMIAIQAASSLAQAYNSEQARKADAAERAKMHDLIEKLQMPNFDVSTITPEEFKVIGKYTPQIAPYIAEKAPQLARLSTEGQAGKDAQLQALRRYQGIAASGEDPILTAQLEQASRATQAEAQSRQASMLQDAARRGQGGTLATLAAQIGGNEAAASRGAEANRQAAMAAYQAKLNAMNQAAGLGGQIAGQDMSQQQMNANIINQFNQRMAQGQNQYGQYAAGLQNQGQLHNLGQAQDAANMNTQARNSAAWQNRGMQNAAQQNAFENARSKIGLETSMYGTNAGARTANTQDQNQMLQAIPNIYSTYQQGQERRELLDELKKRRQGQETTSNTGSDYGSYS